MLSHKRKRLQKHLDFLRFIQYLASFMYAFCCVISRNFAYLKQHLQNYATKRNGEHPEIRLSVTIGYCVSKNLFLRFFLTFFGVPGLHFPGGRGILYTGCVERHICLQRQVSKPHVEKVRISIGSTLPIMTTTARTAESKGSGGAVWHPRFILTALSFSRRCFRFFSRICIRKAD